MAVCLNLRHLVELLQANSVHLSDEILSATIAGVTTDSRTPSSGQVFVALKGERFDGHDFVEAAYQQGAIAAITDHPITTPAGQPLPCLVVKDTLAAYQRLGQWWRDQFSIPIVAITGSVGKTTTKELIAAVLATHGSVLKTQANYNNEIGVPKTLLELRPDHNYAVIEMGMRASGEIALLTHIAHPTLAVITNVGTAHIGRLGSEQAIANAKCELLANLEPDGVAILNYENTRLIETAAQVWQGKTITYGLDGGDIQGQLVDMHTLVVDGVPFPLPLPGRHNALNYLAALAVARVLNLNWAPLTQGVAIDLPQGRAKRYTLPEDIVLLDETYNAGMESMTAALHLLAQTPGTRHIAVLGTMKELGERSPEFHHQVGQVAQSLHLDRLLILADPAESRAMALGANPIPTEEFSNPTEVVQRLVKLVQPGDRLLFKASRAVGLDQVVEAFKQALNEGEPG